MPKIYLKPGIFGILTFFVSILAICGTNELPVGFFTGNFDPPTLGHISMIQCSLKESFNQQTQTQDCPANTRQFSKIIIGVENNSSMDPLTSSDERILLLKKSIGTSFGNRIQIQTVSLKEKINIYNQLKKEYKNNTLWINETPSLKKSSEEVKLQFYNEQLTKKLLDPQIEKIILELGLYSPLPQSLKKLQFEMFKESFGDFVNDALIACPAIFYLTPKKCEVFSKEWKNIIIVESNSLIRAKTKSYKNSSNKIYLNYVEGQSESRWGEKFVESLLAKIPEGKNKELLFNNLSPMVKSIFQNIPYGKVSHLRTIIKNSDSMGLNEITSNLKNNENLKSDIESILPINCNAPDSRSSYNMNMKNYLRDRFPESFKNFLEKQKEKGKFSNNDLYIHNNSIDETILWHEKQGYSKFYFLQTRRGQPHRYLLLASKKEFQHYRLIATEVRGMDRRENVLCQLQRLKIITQFHNVNSSQPIQLFKFSDLGEEIKFNSNDLFLFGFKGVWRDNLSKVKKWKITPLTLDNGLDIDLYEDPSTPNNPRLIIARNVFGDDVKIVLSTFYNKGIRKVIYLGTAGAIYDYDIGSITVPKEFYSANDSAKKGLEISNLWAQKLLKSSDFNSKVKINTHHIGVTHLFSESINNLNEWKSKGLSSVDVEGYHLAEFANSNEDLKISIFFIISDKTLGKETIDQSNGNGKLIVKSTHSLVRHLITQIF